MSAPLLHRLHRLLARGLERTRALWPDIRRAYGWVHRAAQILKNEAGLPAEAVAHRFDGLLGAMAHHRATVGGLIGAIDHFLKVTRSYRPFIATACPICRAPTMISSTCSERIGITSAAPRGARRLRRAWCCAARCACWRPPRHNSSRGDLARADQRAWRDLRQQLERRRYPRVLGRRFRRDPVAYLQQLEAALFQQTLPT